MDHDCEGTRRHSIVPIDLVQQGSRSSEAEVLFEHLPNRRSRSLSYHCFRVHMNRIPGQLSAPADVDVLAEALRLLEVHDLLLAMTIERRSCDERDACGGEFVHEVGEEEMIDLFEREDEGPYYGSYHLLVFDILHPEKFAKHGVKCKQVYEGTWYQWVKNFNFAVQYGAVEASGTADRAAHVKGAQRKIQRRFGKVADLNTQMIQYAQKHGYVETMPDKTVDPKRGYPLLCSRSKWGGIIPTVPLNYHVQGTACWWMMKAMIRVQAYLDKLNARKGSKGYYMVMQIHDELVFDFPEEPHSIRHNLANLSKIRKIQKLMERGGDDIGLPTPVGIEYHPKTWSEGVTV